jgi:hypothetical protein
MRVGNFRLRSERLAAMRTVFIATVVVVIGGLVFFSAIGLLHR